MPPVLLATNTKKKKLPDISEKVMMFFWRLRPFLGPPQLLPKNGFLVVIPFSSAHGPFFP